MTCPRRDVLDIDRTKGPQHRAQPTRAVHATGAHQGLPYNSNTLVVDVRGLVKLLLELRVSLARPVTLRGPVSQESSPDSSIWDRSHQEQRPTARQEGQEGKGLLTGHHQGAGQCGSPMSRPCFSAKSSDSGCCVALRSDAGRNPGAEDGEKLGEEGVYDGQQRGGS